MYYWKCWYSTRWVVCVYLLLVAVAAGAVLYHAPVHIKEHFSLPLVWRFVAGLVPVVGFTAWILGSIGLSRDIAEGSGAYLLTRPRTVRSLVWSDFAVAMAELLLLILVPLGLFALAIRTGTLYFAVPAATTQLSMASDRLPASVILLILLALFVFSGLVYSVSYLFTAMLRRTGFAIFLSAAFYILYSLLEAHAVSWRRPFNLLLPPWLVVPDNHYSTALGPQLLPLGLRILAILVLIFAAQTIVERVETRA